jgi:GTP-binding protein
VFRDAFALKGVPLRLEFKTGENPFKGRKNELTGRQVKKRKRLRERTKS